MSGKVSSKIIRDGLILYLDGGNPKSYMSGSTIWNDLTYYKNNGILTNGPTFNPNNGGSIVFDGVNDYVNVTPSTTFNVQSITIDIWVKFNYFNTFNPLVTNPQNGTINGGWSNPWTSWLIRINNSTTVEFGFGSISTYSYQYFSNNFSPNIYYNIVGTYDGTTICCYINGIKLGENPLTTTINYTSKPVLIGSDFGSSFTNSDISNVKVYNKALSSSEVSQNYDALKSRFENTPTISIVTDGLILYLDSANPTSYPGTGTTWYNLISNGINGALINSPTFNTTNGGYLSFDGISQYVNINSISPYLRNISNFTYTSILKVNGSVFYNRHFFSYGDSGSYPNDLTFFYDNGNIVALQVNNLADGSAYMSYNSNVWSYLTIVYDGTQVGNQNRLKFYINGVQQTLNYTYTVPSTTSPNVYSNTWIGGYTSNNGNFLNFDTSFVTIYNKSLSDSEVLQNYNALKNRIN